MKIIFAGLLAGLVAGIVIVGGNRWLAAQDRQHAIAQAEKDRRELEVTHRRTCLNQLKMIDNAVQQWALENNKSDRDPVQPGDLITYIVGGWPQCPAGGIYDCKNAGRKPTCNIHNHQLP